MKQIVIEGQITEGGFSDGSVIYVGDGEALAYQLDLDLPRDKPVTVRYWITKEPLPKAELTAAYILTIAGALHARCEAKYSEYTGLLSPDNLLQEMYSHLGKYARIEIDINN